MTRPFSVVIVLILSLSLAASALEAQDKALLDAAATGYARLFGKSFTVTMVSPEIAQLLQNAVAQKSQQMMGAPIVINIRHFILSAKNGQFNSKAVLNNPDEQMRQMMEAQANQLLESSGISKTLADLTLGALAKAAAQLKDQEQINLEKADAQAPMFSVKNPSERLFGTLSVTRALFKVNQSSKDIPEFRFDFNDGSAVWLQLRHAAVNAGDGVLQCPSMMLVSHTLKVMPAGMSIPQRISVAFSNYDFQ
jgi:hypothetical protein